MSTSVGMPTLVPPANVSPIEVIPDPIYLQCHLMQFAVTVRCVEEQLNALCCYIISCKSKNVTCKERQSHDLIFVAFVDKWW
jgi:hypothetical protein